MSDHIHLLVSLGKEIAVSDLLRLLKTNSSKWIHEEFPDQQDFAWQTGYGAFAVSFSNLEQVKRYIANQAKHRAKLSFKEDFVALLKKHDIEYDEKYLWE